MAKRPDGTNPEAKAILAAFSAGWEATAEVLTASGQPWPDEAIAIDVAYLIDQATGPTAQRVPGRRALARRWNISDRQARTHLETIPLAIRSRPAPVPRASHRDKGQPAESGPIDPAPVPPPSRERPAPDPPFSSPAVPAPVPAPAENNTPSADADDWQRAVDAWKAHKPKGAALTKRKGAGKRIAVLVREHGLDAWLLVVDWLHRCPDRMGKRQTRAGFLRESGHDQLSTVTSWTNFETYVGMAREWDAAGRPTSSRDEWRAIEAEQHEQHSAKGNGHRRPDAMVAVLRDGEDKERRIPVVAELRPGVDRQIATQIEDDNPGWRFQRFEASP